MRRWQSLVLILGLLATASALAADVDGAKPVRPAHHRHARHSAAHVQRQVARHESEVRQLQQDIAKQESTSSRANKRLQQQDQAIAELQNQLRQVHAKPAGDHH